MKIECVLAVIFTIIEAAELFPSNLLSKIKKNVINFDDETLNSHIALVQTFQDGATKYSFQSEEKFGRVVFARNESDDGKEIVILNSEEDKLPQWNNDKNTFVVLIRCRHSPLLYHVLHVHLRASGDLEWDEWDEWDRHGWQGNLANIFGFVSCNQSSILPCKQAFPIKGQSNVDHSFKKPSKEAVMWFLNSSQEISNNNFFCDLLPSFAEIRIVSEITSIFAQAVNILTTSALLYDEEDELRAGIEEEVGNIMKKEKILSKLPIGFFGKKFTTNLTEEMIKKGRTAASRAVSLLSTEILLTLLAVEYELSTDRFSNITNFTESQLEELQKVANDYLTAFFGESDAEEVGINPNPSVLLKEDVNSRLIKCKNINKQSVQGRSFMSAVFGHRNTKNTKNGEQIIRHYGQVQKDGSVTGSKALDNLNYAIDNAFGSSSDAKSAGQIFAEALSSALYAPTGLIDDAADATSGGIFGMEGVSKDRSYIDDLLDKLIRVVTGPVAQILDAVADLLAPFGLTGVSKAIAGLGGAALGIAGGAAGIPGTGVHALIKIASKGLGSGGAIGMYGDKARAKNKGGNQNTNRNTPAQNQKTVILNHIIPKPRRKRRIQKRSNDSVFDEEFQPSEEGSELSSDSEQNAVNMSDSAAVHISLPKVVTEVDLFRQFGWETIDLTQRELYGFRPTKNTIFSGFDNCPSKIVKASMLEAIKDAQEALEIYMKMFRGSCHKNKIAELTSLMEAGIVKFEKSAKVFKLDPKHSIFSKRLLSSKEASKLSKAFELSSLSQAVFDNVVLGSANNSDHSIFSSIIRSMTFNILTDATMIAKQHYVKIIRNAIKRLKIFLAKRLQDFYRMQFCKKCSKKTRNWIFQDIKEIYSLMGYLIMFNHEKGINSGGKSLEESLENWTNDNSLHMEEIIQRYKP